MSTREDPASPQPEESTSTASHPETRSSNPFSPLLSDPDTHAAAEDAPIREPGSKACTFCHTRRNVLIRCQHDASRRWAFVCTGACWRSVSGGLTGGDRAHEHYRYGGTWKNKHAFVSAKIKGRAKEENAQGWRTGRVWKKGTKGKAGEGRELRELRGGDGGDLLVGELGGGDGGEGGEEEEEEEWEWHGEVEEGTGDG